MHVDGMPARQYTASRPEARAHGRGSAAAIATLLAAHPTEKGLIHVTSVPALRAYRSMVDTDGESEAG
jgi:hypothetical protein